MKTIVYSLSALLILSACNKNTPTPTPTPEPVSTNDPVELLASGKGFKRAYRYTEASTFTGSFGLFEIHALDLTTQGTGTCNFAFKHINAFQGGTVSDYLKSSFNTSDGSTLSAAKSLTFTQSSSHNVFGTMFAPYTNSFAYMAYTSSAFGVNFLTLGDINETCSERGDMPRLGKHPHLIFSPKGYIQGSNWFNYGYKKADGTEGAYQYAPSVFSTAHKGLFEIIPNTNDGVLIMFRGDSVVASIQSLNTPLIKPVRAFKATVTQTLNPDDLRKIMIKNNENTNDFAFACFSYSNSLPDKVWTFKYNYSTKVITVVSDGVLLPAGTNIISQDLDTEGNLYYLNNNSVYKVNAAGVSTVASGILNKGSAEILRWFNGKLYLMAVNYSQTDSNGAIVQARRQLDVLVQE